MSVPLSDWLSLVKKAMTDKKISQSKLSEDTGVSKSYISEIINGKKEPRFSVVIALMLGLGIVPLITFENANTTESDGDK